MAQPFYRGNMPRIMIVDDDPTITQCLSDLIQLEGFDTAISHNWGQLFSQLKRINIDLIILDIMLPGMSGIEIIKLLKQNEIYRIIPVIMVTAMDIHTAKNLIRPCYTQFLFQKPVDLDILYRTIHSAITS